MNNWKCKSIETGEKKSDCQRLGKGKTEIAEDIQDKLTTLMAQWWIHSTA